LVNLLASGDSTATILAANTLALFRPLSPAVYRPVLVYTTIAVTKLPNYVLPLMPAAAILVALMEREIKASSPPILKRQDRQSWFLLQLSGWLNVVFLLVAGSLFCIPYLRANPNLRSYVQQSGLPVLGV